MLCYGYPVLSTTSRRSSAHLVGWLVGLVTFLIPVCGITSNSFLPHHLSSLQHIWNGHVSPNWLFFWNCHKTIKKHFLFTFKRVCKLLFDCGSTLQPQEQVYVVTVLNAILYNGLKTLFLIKVILIHKLYNLNMSIIKRQSAYEDKKYNLFLSIKNTENSFNIFSFSYQPVTQSDGWKMMHISHFQIISKWSKSFIEFRRYNSIFITDVTGIKNRSAVRDNLYIHTSITSTDMSKMLYYGKSLLNTKFLLKEWTRLRDRFKCRWRDKLDRFMKDSDTAAGNRE